VLSGVVSLLAHNLPARFRLVRTLPLLRRSEVLRTVHLLGVRLVLKARVAEP